MQCGGKASRQAPTSVTERANGPPSRYVTACRSLSEWACSNSSPSGTGLPKKYPWPMAIPSARIFSTCSYVSTPSATIERFNVFAS